MLSIRDPIHGFIRADPLESALVSSKPMQRLRFIRQLGLKFLIFPGAEHSRFSHALGVMHLAGRVYDAVATKADGMLDPDPRAPGRRLVRAAALLHDIGHAPFSHSAEDLFDQPIDHEDMTCRLLELDEMTEIFRTLGDGLDAAAVERVLRAQGDGGEQLLTEIVTGQLDADKMDYLLRDSLYCGVRYGHYDLERLLDTMVPIEDPETRDDPGTPPTWRIGVDLGGVHALEALVMARYYMFTQVYFHPTSKVMEMHLNAWLRDIDHRWPSDPETFLEQDDVTVFAALRASSHPHARAITHRERYRLAYETREHMTEAESERFESLFPKLYDRFGEDNLLIDRAAKSPHQLGKTPVWVRRFDGSLESMHEASNFIAHLSRIDTFRVYAPGNIRDEVKAAVEEAWQRG